MDEHLTGLEDPPPRRDRSNLVGWVLLIALAVGVLALRFFGGGGC